MELNALTGTHTLRRVHILQDAGSSLNPAIDIGQVEGAFVQGLGLYTMEELLWAADGHLRTRNVSTYKVPSAGDIPAHFRVELLAREGAGERNPLGIFGQRSCGEIGVPMAFVVHCALRSAVAAFRRDEMEDSRWFEMNAPATVEVLRELCEITP